MEDSSKHVSGFSKLNKRDKIGWIAKNFLYSNPIDLAKEFAGFWHDNVEQQKLFDGFSENTLTNFYMPFGVSPNFLINGQVYCVPMVIEESSVVAAASKAAKFWMDRGGFRAKVLSSTKVGQVHFKYSGRSEKLLKYFPHLKEKLIEDAKPVTRNMEARGGGILDIELLDCTHLEPDFYQLKAEFETCDSMGANFINSCLEGFAKCLVEAVEESVIFNDDEQIEIIMSILSNYTPDCIVRAEVACKVEELGGFSGGTMSGADFARRFVDAVTIASIDVHRATTHNKGIMNGIDAVVIATGNDFRAVESCAHTYACRDGQYRSLSMAEVNNGIFKFWLDIPMAIGTVGGLTSLHPLAKKSLQILGNPSADELMQIAATVGLAQNFGAIRSLVTTGIQAGHMKMHLSNILSQFNATEEEIVKVRDYFVDKIVSFSAVRDFLDVLRGKASL